MGSVAGRAPGRFSNGGELDGVGGKAKSGEVENTDWQDSGEALEGKKFSIGENEMEGFLV